MDNDMKDKKFQHGYGYEDEPILIPDNVKPKLCSELIPGKYYFHIEIIPVHLLTNYNSYKNIKAYDMGQFVGIFKDIPIFKDWCAFDLALKRSLDGPAFMIYDALEIYEALGIDIFYRNCRF